MTPTEKDAMALAVLERLTDQFGREHGTFGNEDHTLWNAATEARAHLASRIAELEAELAAVLNFLRDDSLAATFQTLGQYRAAAINAAREGK